MLEYCGRGHSSIPKVVLGIERAGDDGRVVFLCVHAATGTTSQFLNEVLPLGGWRCYSNLLKGLGLENRGAIVIVIAIVAVIAGIVVMVPAGFIVGIVVNGERKRWTMQPWPLDNFAAARFFIDTVLRLLRRRRRKRTCIVLWKFAMALLAPCLVGRDLRRVLKRKRRRRGSQGSGKFPHG